MSKSRHLACPNCRYKLRLKRNKKHRICVECSKKFVGIRNKCNSCKYSKEQKQREYKNCASCGKLFKRAGSLCTTCKNKHDYELDPNKYKRYYFNNLEKCKKRYTDYRKKHPEKNRIQSGKYRAKLIGSIPEWANLKKIEEIYQQCPKDKVVDHIIPLNNNYICGLHVESNLQYLTKTKNCSKSNQFDGTYNNKTWETKLLKR
jgi:hypothetical protein